VVVRVVSLVVTMTRSRMMSCKSQAAQTEPQYRPAISTRMQAPIRVVSGCDNSAENSPETSADRTVPGSLPGVLFKLEVM
jgi:hypothetical protein